MNCIYSFSFSFRYLCNECAYLYKKEPVLLKDFPCTFSFHHIFLRRLTRRVLIFERDKQRFLSMATRLVQTMVEKAPARAACLEPRSYCARRKPKTMMSGGNYWTGCRKSIRQQTIILPDRDVEMRLVIGP